MRPEHRPNRNINISLGRKEQQYNINEDDDNVRERRGETRSRAVWGSETQFAVPGYYLNTFETLVPVISKMEDKKISKMEDKKMSREEQRKVIKLNIK